MSHCYEVGSFVVRQLGRDRVTFLILDKGQDEFYYGMMCDNSEIPICQVEVSLPMSLTGLPYSLVGYLGVKVWFHQDEIVDGCSDIGANVLSKELVDDLLMTNFGNAPEHFTTGIELSDEIVHSVLSALISRFRNMVESIA